MKKPSMKCKVISVLLTNTLIALSISITAQIVGQLLETGTVHFSFALLGINFCLAYIISFAIGMLIPAVPWGIKFALKCKAKPDSLPFGLLLNLIVNTVYVVINCLILTYVNVFILSPAFTGAPKPPFIPVYPLSVVSTFVPIWVVGFIVSFLWSQPADKIAHKICKE